MAALTDDDDFRQRTQTFLSWSSQQGIVLSNKISLIDLRHLLLGRAVYSTHDIEEDEDLFTIPRSAILTPQTTTLPTEITSELDDPWLALILVLIYENQQGSNSRWKPYLDILPTQFDTLMYWEEPELKWLQGSAVVAKIGKEKANETFTTKIIPIVRKHEESFVASTLTDHDLLVLCHRMGSTIMAYAFDLERQDTSNDASAEDGWEADSDDGSPLPVGMVPMADMLNADADRNNAKLFYEEDRVVMRSIKKIASNEEIFNDYGPNPSGDLLRRYGYLTPLYAKYDVVEVAQAVVLSVAKTFLNISDADAQQRLDHLEAEMPTDAFDIAHAESEDGQFSIEMLATLRCLAMSQADFDKLKSKGKMPSDKPLNEDEHTVLQLLRAIILRRQQDYSPDPPQPSATRAEAVNSQHIRRQFMATQVISGEKIVLQEAYDIVDNMLAPTDKKRKLGVFNIEPFGQSEKRQR